MTGAILTDEQRKRLVARYYVGESTISALYDEAFRLGMLRAAEIADSLSTRAGTADDAAGAIRAAAEASPPPREP